MTERYECGECGFIKCKCAEKARKICPICLIPSCTGCSPFVSAGTMPVPAATQGANTRQVGGEHYVSSIQHWDYVLANNIPYMEAQIIKYVSRWRKKGGMQDLEKAKHFLEKLIEHESNK